MLIDSTLVAAVITSVATLVAAFITITTARKANENLKDDDKYSIFNKTYTILVREEDDKVIVIKDGFSWVALFFHIFWLFYCKLWEVIFTTILIIGAIFIHLYIVDYISERGYLEYYIRFLQSVLFYVPILLGAFGNRLLMRKYTHSFCLFSKDTYAPKSSVIATTKTNALLKYMEK